MSKLRAVATRLSERNLLAPGDPINAVGSIQMASRDKLCSAISKALAMNLPEFRAIPAWRDQLEAEGTEPIPHFAVDPVSREIMTDPYITNSGNTYQFESLQATKAVSDAKLDAAERVFRDPITRQPIQMAIRNHQLRDSIDNWIFQQTGLHLQQLDPDADKARQQERSQQLVAPVVFPPVVSGPAAAAAHDHELDYDVDVDDSVNENEESDEDEDDVIRPITIVLLDYVDDVPIHTVDVIRDNHGPTDVWTIAQTNYGFQADQIAFYTFDGITIHPIIESAGREVEVPFVNRVFYMTQAWMDSTVKQNVVLHAVMWDQAIDNWYIQHIHDIDQATSSPDLWRQITALPPIHESRPLKILIRNGNGHVSGGEWSVERNLRNRNVTGMIREMEGRQLGNTVPEHAWVLYSFVNDADEMPGDSTTMDIGVLVNGISLYEPRVSIEVMNDITESQLMMPQGMYHNYLHNQLAEVENVNHRFDKVLVLSPSGEHSEWRDNQDVRDLPSYGESRVSVEFAYTRLTEVGEDAKSECELLQSKYTKPELVVMAHWVETQLSGTTGIETKRQREHRLAFDYGHKSKSQLCDYLKTEYSKAYYRLREWYRNHHSSTYELMEIVGDLQIKDAGSMSFDQLNALVVERIESIRPIGYLDSAWYYLSHLWSKASGKVYDHSGKIAMFIFLAGMNPGEREAKYMGADTWWRAGLVTGAAGLYLANRIKKGFVSRMNNNKVYVPATKGIAFTSSKVY